MRDDPGWPALSVVDPVQVQPELPFRGSVPDDQDVRPRLGRYFASAEADEATPTVAPDHFPGVPRLDNLLPAVRPRPRPRIVAPRTRVGRPVPRPRAR